MLAVFCAGVYAQAYPSRAIRVIVPYVPGGLDASREQGPAERGAGTRLRDATVKLATSASFLAPAPRASPGSDPEGSPLPPCDAPRLRDVTDRESAAAAVLIAQVSNSSPQYPNRAIRLIVPYVPGGGTDFVGRTVAQKLSEALGSTVFVENRPGGGTNIGSEFVAHAAADGYTLLLGGVPNTANMALFKKMSYDVVRDFAPVILIDTAPNMLAVHPSVPAKSVKELIALAKTRRGALTYASAGIGSSNHLSGELFRVMAGIEIIHVPYKGGGAAVTDLLAGQVSMYFGTTPSTLPFVQSGRLRALGVTTAKRTVAAPRAADDRGGGAARLRAIGVARTIGARRHAGRRDREAQCRGHPACCVRRMSSNGLRRRAST